MDGPLAPEIYDTTRHQPSWWEASAPPPRPRPALAGEYTVEVAVIGGGYAGLSCARHLAERGIGATVLEAGEIGWGSSGRNGGIVCYGGTKLAPRTLERRFGAAEVARSHALQAEGIEQLRAFCRDAGLGDQIQGTSELILGHSPAAAAAARAEPGAIPVPPSGLDDIARHGGARLPPSFGIHPLRLVRAIADRAEAAGVRICPRTEVTVWERAGNGHRLVTAGGAVRAARVVLATNAFTPDDLHERFRARTVPALSNIAVTRPLTGEERARHPWLGPDPAADTRHLLCYFRMLPEGRLLFGIRGDLSGSDAGIERMRTRLAARIARELPGLAGIAFTHFWRGPVCLTAGLRPAIGRLPEAPTVWHAFGWHGSGINMGTLAGRLVADAIAGAPEKTIPDPWRGLPPAIPIPGLRPIYLGAALMGYALADRLG